MQTLWIAVAAGVGFLVAYFTYGRWLGRRIFELSSGARCPSRAVNDGVDYVPTHRSVVFGHHFTSIAGTGPIVGPAIAVMWGWLPALLWVVFGSIFIGAVHDFGALVVSLRNNGQTVGEIAGRLLNPRVRVLFLLILFMALTIVLAIFGLVIAAVFRMYPASIFPCVVQIPIAVAIGVWLHRHGRALLVPSLIALGVMYLTVIYGDRGWLHTVNDTLRQWPTMTWVVVLLLYSYVASVLPVWALLQPRDYINSLQLISALGLIVVGLFVAAVYGGAPMDPLGNRPPLEIVGPRWDFEPNEAPLMFPFLFITVACGAISGFHCLVSSGTSSKQLESETDARFVGYGGMLTEGFLATLVILACVAGLGLGIEGADGKVLFGEAAWGTRYASWSAAGGLPAKVGAFVDGSANFLKAIGIKGEVAVALMGVLVASFAGTTLDTACRLQRYVVQELAGTMSGRSAAAGAGGDAGWGVNPVGWLTNKHAATVFAIVTAAVLAGLPFSGQPWSWATAGKGGMILWPLFGATNQLLGGLAFLVIGFYLWRRSKPVAFLVLPTLFMLLMPAWAMYWQVFVQAVGEETSWLDDHNWVLIVIGLVTIALEVWMIAEAVIMLPARQGCARACPAGDGDGWGGGGSRRRAGWDELLNGWAWV